ncbi:MAG: hypothetical protein QN155_10855 [Armatimonadota bacterium]|nr:hypothetical protein [Armatimonadota bacterium]MDR7403513.1 hypothetical protein [Armatimonadota bacterium]MDR7559964.1 hypothetical protein [Armatimonadota bacterium]MDR7587680.1 hypothetical protein [Armatimonadota bacterium]MDR7611491.1 hypothetical protein [Armatimonadota bacterium]
MRHRPGVLLTLCVVLSSGMAAAQVPAKHRQFVYGINAFSWEGYVGGLSATPAHTIYLLAHHSSVISARETLVYYWPITGEYRADWSSLNVSIPGMLEVVQDGRVVASFTAQPYVIQYPQGPDRGPSILYTGSEAWARYEEFVAARERWRQAMAQYLRARQRHLETLARLRHGRPGGTTNVPPPPREPPPFLRFSTEVHDGFIVSVPAGRYTIRLRQPDGRVRAGSQRTLVSFTHRRESIGFTIVPQARWTVPERADDPLSVIYARADQVLYFQPFAEREYNDLAYARLLNPQSREGRPDAWRWQYTHPQPAASLVIRGPGGVSRVDRRGFRVVQTPGEALGYEVVEPTPGQDADFDAYRVRVQGRMEVALIDEAGRILPGSSRSIRIPRSGPTWPLTLIPAIPLTIGATAVARRRQRLHAFRPRAARRLPATS